MASPFAGAMSPVLANPQVPTFSEQGEAIGKTKGRKRTPKTTTEAETSTAAKRPRKSRTEKDGKGNQNEPKVEVPPLESIKDQVKPPPHVTAGHVYSSAYRKHQSLYGKLDVAGAQKTAQMASAIFQSYGIVSAQQVGKFNKEPRKPATPRVPPVGGQATPANGEGQSGANGADEAS